MTRTAQQQANLDAILQKAKALVDHRKLDLLKRQQFDESFAMDERWRQVEKMAKEKP